VKRGRTKKDMPFKAERRHQYWTTDIRYLDMHQLGGGMIYCISFLENFSRAILASAISRRKDTEAYLAGLYAAIRKHGVPEVLVSDNGGVFRSYDAIRIYEALGNQKVEIEKRKPGNRISNQILTHKEGLPTGILSAHEPGKTCWLPTRSGCSTSTISIILPMNSARMVVTRPRLFWAGSKECSPSRSAFIARFQQ